MSIGGNVREVLRLSLFFLLRKANIRREVAVVGSGIWVRRINADGPSCAKGDWERERTSREMAAGRWAQATLSLAAVISTTVDFKPLQVWYSVNFVSESADGGWRRVGSFKVRRYIGQKKKVGDRKWKKRRGLCRANEFEVGSFLTTTSAGYVRAKENPGSGHSSSLRGSIYSGPSARRKWRMRTATSIDTRLIVWS